MNSPSTPVKKRQSVKGHVRVLHNGSGSTWVRSHTRGPRGEGLPLSPSSKARLAAIKKQNKDREEVVALKRALRATGSQLTEAKRQITSLKKQVRTKNSKDLLGLIREPKSLTVEREKAKREALMQQLSEARAALQQSRAALRREKEERERESQHYEDQVQASLQDARVARDAEAENMDLRKRIHKIQTANVSLANFVEDLQHDINVGRSEPARVHVIRQKDKKRNSYEVSLNLIRAAFRSDKGDVFLFDREKPCSCSYRIRKKFACCNRGCHSVFSIRVPPGVADRFLHAASRAAVGPFRDPLCPVEVVDVSKLHIDIFMNDAKFSAIFHEKKWLVVE